jgi:Spy/CpxP family protein refolding chaperone
VKTVVKTYLIWIVIILLVANLSAFITVLFFMKKQTNQTELVGRSNKVAPSENPGRAMMSDFNFNNEQQVRFKEIRYAHNKKVSGINRDIHLLRKEIVEHLSKENVNEQSIDSLAKKFGVLQTQLKKEVFRNFIEVKNICNEEQKKKLMLHINHVVDQNVPGPGMRRKMRHGRKKNINK